MSRVDCTTRGGGERKGEGRKERKTCPSAHLDEGKILPPACLAPRHPHSLNWTCLPTVQWNAEKWRWVDHFGTTWQTDPLAGAS